MNQILSNFFRLGLYCVIGVVISLILTCLIFFVTIKYGDQIETSFFYYSQGKSIENGEKELLIPYINEWDTNNYESNNLTQFHSLVKNNFKYSKKYDCKYWSFIWGLWAYHHSEWNSKIVKATDSHLYTLLYNNEKGKYCRADQTKLSCENINN